MIHEHTLAILSYRESRELNLHILYSEDFNACILFLGMISKSDMLLLGLLSPGRPTRRTATLSHNAPCPWWTFLCPCMYA